MYAQWRLRSAWASTQSDQYTLCALWVAKDPSFLHADSEDSDQTGRMPRLIWVFAGYTLILLVLSCHGSNEFKIRTGQCGWGLLGVAYDCLIVTAMVVSYKNSKNHPKVHSIHTKWLFEKDSWFNLKNITIKQNKPITVQDPFAFGLSSSFSRSRDDDLLCRSLISILSTWRCSLSISSCVLMSFAME